MLNRFLIVLLLIPSIHFGEIIKVSRIKNRDIKELKIIRNIFSPNGRIGDRGKKVTSDRIDKVKTLKNTVVEKKEDKIITTVFYEGYLIKGERVFALLKVNGEFFVSKEGDEIPGKIILKRIMEKRIILEIESSEVSISKKGEDNVK